MQEPPKGGCPDELLDWEDEEERVKRRPQWWIRQRTVGHKR